MIIFILIITIPRLSRCRWCSTSWASPALWSEAFQRLRWWLSWWGQPDQWSMSSANLLNFLTFWNFEYLHIKGVHWLLRKAQDHPNYKDCQGIWSGRGGIVVIVKLIKSPKHSHQHHILFQPFTICTMTLSTNYDFQVYKQLSEKNDTIIRNVLDIDASKASWGGWWWWSKMLIMMIVLIHKKY